MSGSPEPDFVIVGTGRSASRYIATVFAALGFRMGHEAYFALPGQEPVRGLQGDSSWLATFRLERFAGLVLHQVRHPYAVTRSLANGELFVNRRGPFYAERCRHFQVTGDNVEDAIRCYLAYVAKSHELARTFWRVEDLDAGKLDEAFRSARAACGLPPIAGEDSVQACQRVLSRIPKSVNRHLTGPEISADPRLDHWVERLGYRDG